MVNYLDIKIDTEFTFLLVKNNHSLEIWMKYNDKYYKLLLIMKSFIFQKLISIHMCNNFITHYIFKKIYIDYNYIDSNIKIIQTIFFTKSNITLKYVS